MFVLFVAFIPILLNEGSCEKHGIELTITENKGGGEDLINLRSYITKRKLQIDPNGQFDFITNEPDSSNYVILDPKTGVLRLRSNIDREAVCKHSDICKITLFVSIDNKVLEISIKIQDENDNAPQFAMRHKTLTVQENNDVEMEFSLPTADDPDSQANGIDRYYMETRTTGNSRSLRHPASAYFKVIEKAINKVKIPYLKTIKPIDREEVESFELILIAEDTGKQQGSCTITVSVSDVNDNTPNWPTTSIYKKVRECERQGPIIELQAFDKDDSSTPNGQIKYKISDHSQNIEVISNIFYIAGSSLFLASQGLQSFQQKEKITFFVTAVDGGGRENETSVTIEIEDCNDHAPIIQLAKRSVTIRENDNTGQIITTITVKDEDRGVNSEFSCDLNDTIYFSITKQHSFRQPKGGMLMMYKIEKNPDTPFDREKINYFSVLIRCVDQGRPALTGEKIFSVSITDENDNPPKFSAPEIQFSITENNVIGALIGYVKAYDPDAHENGRVTYQIVNNDDNYYFTITSLGKIETKWKFDRETKDSYSLIVIAKDNGVPSLNDTCTVKIKVLDVNDCTPTFRQQYFYQIPESNGMATIHSILGKISAEDQDLGENGTVSYMIRDGGQRHGSQQSLVKITLDGTLSVYGVVDREETSSIQVEVIAYDNGRPPTSSFTTVIIDVLDVNDNKPKFKSSSNRNFINVSADTPAGTILASIEAEDPDKGENGTITYSIIGNKKTEENLPFQLQQDGRIILVRNLKDQETPIRIPDRLLIKASDGGSPSKSEILTLTIKVNKELPKVGGNSWDLKDPKYPKNRINPDNMNNYNDSGIPDNLILLYILAGVLFVVFLIVLLVLLYTYMSGKFHRGRDPEQHQEKELNNYYKDMPVNYECETLNPDTIDAQDDFNKINTELSMSPGKSNKTHYTHLMMMSDSKYTPIQISSHYIQTLSNNAPGFSLANSSHNYEPCGQERDNTVNRQKTNLLQNRWNSIEDISKTHQGVKDGKYPKKSLDNSFFYNAHSYAAYINQFGVEDKDGSGNGENSKTLKSTIKLQNPTLTGQKQSKEELKQVNYQFISVPDSVKPQNKKCYVTSSFV